jgi:hypothetical protein
VHAWLASAREVAVRAGAVVRVRAAEDWLGVTANELRDARSTPIRAAAQGYWQELRQGSNVSLGEIVLRGSGRSSDRTRPPDSSVRPSVAGRSATRLRATDRRPGCFERPAIVADFEAAHRLRART